MRVVLARLVLSCLACFFVAYRVPAQSPIPVGGEFQANSFTTNSQRFPAVAVDSDGDFIVAWSSTGQDGGSDGLFAQRFNAAGVAQAVELQINTHTASSQRSAAVAIRDSGEFVVVWTSSGQDGPNSGVFAQRFDAAGVALGGELLVNTYTVGNQLGPAVALGAAGDFVVAWSSGEQDGSDYGVFARLFDATGQGQASEFQVNTYTDDRQSYASVALADGGGFIVVWQSQLQDESGAGIFARRFDTSGVAQATELQVNSYTADDQGAPRVVNAGGEFVVVWHSDLQDGSGYGVFGSRFDATLEPLAAEFQVSGITMNSQITPAIAAKGDGGFVVAWLGYSAGLNAGDIFVRGFDADGAADDAVLRVNTYTTGLQAAVAVSMNDNGSFVVAWHDEGQDGSSHGVFAQRFLMPAVIDIDGDGETSPLTDGVLTLRYLFGFTGATLVTGAFDPVNCTRCDPAAIEAYLKTLD